ncbi:MAG: xanthine phosphoribosyltransferase [Ruminococcaceae bacterium]|nr:xanthine phosphoribosyltransferase [Oscillospiraceae bacterium]
MELLKERIRKDGKVRSGNVLKVDSFLNHQMDITLFEEIGKEFKRRFSDCSITKILTIESSGIGIACIAAQSFGVPVVFAKKNTTKNIDGAVFSAQIESFTHGRVYNVVVAREYLSPNDNILIIDDFLANGKALIGLEQIVKKSGASLAGAGIVIEKGFQNGGKELREAGMRIESLAVIKSMSEDGKIEFE